MATRLQFSCRHEIHADTGLTPSAQFCARAQKPSRLAAIPMERTRAASGSFCTCKGLVGIWTRQLSELGESLVASRESRQALATLERLQPTCVGRFPAGDGAPDCHADMTIAARIPSKSVLPAGQAAWSGDLGFLDGDAISWAPRFSARVEQQPQLGEASLFCRPNNLFSGRNATRAAIPIH